MQNLAFYLAAQTGVATKGEGLPGASKTACMNAFAKAAGRSIYTLIGSLREPADIGGYPYPQEVQTIDGKKVYIQLVPPKWAIDCWNGEKWIVFLDELTCVPPAVQSAMLRILAEKVVGDTPLPLDTWFVAACNPPGLAANGHDLEPPMANRMCHLPWHMDRRSWSHGMLNGLAFPDPQPPVLPDHWRDFIPNSAGMIAAYINRHPEMLELRVNEYGVPLEKGRGDELVPMDRSKLSGAWTSPRSWTNASIVLAAAESVGAPLEVRQELPAGCVGQGAADGYFAWRRDLDLPDPEALIAEGINAAKEQRPVRYEHPKRTDLLIVMVQALTEAIRVNRTPERWRGAMTVFESVAEKNMEALCCATALVTRIPPGEEIPASFKRYLPMLKRLAA